MFKFATFLIWCFMVLAGAVLFWTSGQVQHAEEKRYAVIKDIEKEKERKAVLVAEWHYLNSPAHLEKMVAAKLSMPENENVVAMLDGATLPQTILPDFPPEKPAVPESFKVKLVAEVKKPAPAKKEKAKKVVQEKPSRDFNAMLASWSGDAR